jgi:hypothetical protein
VDRGWAWRLKGIAADWGNRPAGMSRLVAMESRVAEDLEPVRMPLAGQQFGGTLADAFGAVAAKEPPVVSIFG